MKIEEIKSLLNKYYQGETSLEEEELLRINLKSVDDLPEDLKADAELFSMMGALGGETTNQDIDLDNKDKKIVPLQLQKSVDYSWFSRIAAGLALLVIGVLSGWLVGNNSGESSEMVAIKK